MKERDIRASLSSLLSVHYFLSWLILLIHLLTSENEESLSCPVNLE